MTEKIQQSTVVLLSDTGARRSELIFEFDGKYESVIFNKMDSPSEISRQLHVLSQNILRNVCGVGLINEFIKKECIVDNAKMVSCIGIYNRYSTFRKERNLEPVTIQFLSKELSIHFPDIKKQRVRMTDHKGPASCYFGLDLIYK